MDLRKVKRLISLLEESGIAELEVKEGEESVRISRYGAYASPQVVPTPAPPAPPAAPSDQGESAWSGSDTPDLPEGHVISAPMVGTYYEASTPGAPAFVTPGQPVRVGDTLCIIEAMKILNEIEADKDGVVIAVLATNGQPVEYGQPLFVIR